MSILWINLRFTSHVTLLCGTGLWMSTCWHIRLNICVFVYNTGHSKHLGTRINHRPVQRLSSYYLQPPNQAGNTLISLNAVRALRLPVNASRACVATINYKRVAAINHICMTTINSIRVTTISYVCDYLSVTYV